MTEIDSNQLTIEMIPETQIIPEEQEGFIIWEKACL